MQDEQKKSLDSIRLPVRVRYPEADPMGYLHHSVHLVYFEMARTELLRKHGISYADLEKEGFFLAVAKASVEYLAPAHYDDLLLVEARLTRAGLVRLEHEYEIWCRNEAKEGKSTQVNLATVASEVPSKSTGWFLIARGSTTLASLNRAGRIQPLPESITKLFEKRR
jgi:acyl-CoA thioester hydrolase